jgi:hypothetical protein
MGVIRGLTRQRVFSALCLASAVGLPWFAGIMVGQATTGATMAFGAYLLVVSFPLLPASHAIACLSGAAVILTGFMFAGTAFAVGSLALVACTTMAAAAQGIAEARNTALRLPTALAALALLVSIGPGSGAAAAAKPAVFFGLGTLVAVLVVWLVVPRGDATSSRGRQLTAGEWARFVGIAGCLGLVGGLLLSFVPTFHPGWLPAAALRVLKPTREETFTRMRSRGLGTLAGAAAGGTLLVWDVSSFLSAATVTLMVFAMLMIGARRYGVWSFCLTAAALAFNTNGGESVVTMAIDRVLLTIGGICLVLIAAIFLPSDGETAGRPS